MFHADQANQVVSEKTTNQSINLNLGGNGTMKWGVADQDLVGSTEAKEIEVARMDGRTALIKSE